MPLKSKFLVALVAFVLLGLGSAVTARADIILTPGNVPQTDENVLLNNGLTGNPIFGLTNNTQLSVRFRGTETLTAPSNGQARVEAADGTLTNLSIDLASTVGGPSTGTFTSLILNLDAATTGFVTFVVTEDNGTVNTFNNVALGIAGQNFFTITAISGQRIANVTFTTTVPVTLSDVAQVRIG